MATVMLIVYWFSLLVVLYTYIGYGIVMAMLARIRNRPAPMSLKEEDLPTVTILIPAYNEADILGPKIRNTLQLNYPKELLQVIVITDGSDDGSDIIVHAFPQVTGMHQAAREGKAMAINRAMQRVEGSITVCTDANAMVDPASLRLLVAHFADSRVGGASGEKRISSTAVDGVSAGGEGLYWVYESWLKEQDAAVQTLVGAAGELFAFRTALFQPFEPDTILDDFMLSLRICLKGYRIAYEPGATATETGSVSLAEEQKRKVRIAAGGYQSMTRLKMLQAAPDKPMLLFQYISHRVLRWTITPLCLILLLVSNLVLVIHDMGGFYSFSFWMQFLFYLAATSGWLGALINKKWPIVSAIYYFVFMHWSAILGGIMYLSGKHSATWEKSKRLNLPVKENQAG